MRDTKECIKNLKKHATIDLDTAISCFYTILDDDKPISGVSVRFAELVVYCWGNISAGSRILETHEKHLLIEGFAEDLQTQNKAKVQLLQPTINRYGNLLPQALLTARSNATSSIAYRNAIFKIIPSAVLGSVHSHIEKFIKRKYDNSLLSDTLTYFTDKGISYENLSERFKLQPQENLNFKEILLLIGAKNALEEGDTDVNTLFNSKKRKTKFEKAFES
jgi:hypothetical protein